jgi:hypothetical protein
MKWSSAPITLLPSTGVPAFISGATTVSAGMVTTILSGNSTINGTLAVAGTLVLGPGVVVHATNVLLIGALNVSASGGGGVQSSGSFTIERSAVLTVVVDSNPGSSSSITVLIAQFASFGGSFGNTSTQATFAEAQCFQLGNPVTSLTLGALSATISVAPLTTASSCGSGAASRALIGIIVGSVIFFLLVVAAVVGACILRRKHANAVQKMKYTIENARF